MDQFCASLKLMIEALCENFQIACHLLIQVMYLRACQDSMLLTLPTKFSVRALSSICSHQRPDTTLDHRSDCCHRSNPSILYRLMSLVAISGFETSFHLRKPGRSAADIFALACTVSFGASLSGNGPNATD